MILDALLKFSDKQAITATAVSTDKADISSPSSQLLDIGTGEDLYVHAVVTTAFTDTDSNSTVTVDFVSDDDPALGSPATVQTLGVFPALSAAGTKLVAKLQPGVKLQKYVGMRYTLANGNLTTGAISAFITKDNDAAHTYSSGFSVSQ